MKAFPSILITSTSNWARRPGFLLLAIAIGCGAPGCRSNCDLVEAELRTRENELREIRADLDRTEQCNNGLQRELQALRQGSSSKITPELAAQTYTIKEIVLGRQTGGYDDDDCPGDEALQVVVEPRDPDGHGIKTPGRLYVEALQITPEGIKTPLSTWEIPPDQLRRTWRSGLLSTGYHVILPWKTWPITNKLRVIVRLTLVDGRVFEADKDVTIRLGQASKPASTPTAVPSEPQMPPVLDTEPTLPAPRRQKSVPATPRPKSGGSDGPTTEALEPAALWQSNSRHISPNAVDLLKPTPLGQ